MCVCACVFIPVEFLKLNLASLQSVRDFVVSFKERELPPNILLNNGRWCFHAGACGGSELRIRVERTWNVPFHISCNNYSAYYPHNDNSWVNTACCYLKKWRSVSLFHECSKTAPQIRAHINAFWSISGRHMSTAAVRRRLQEPGERRATDSSHGPGHGKGTLDKWETGTYSSLMSSDLIWSEVPLFGSKPCTC